MIAEEVELVEVMELVDGVADEISVGVPGRGSGGQRCWWRRWWSRMTWWMREYGKEEGAEEWRKTTGVAFGSRVVVGMVRPAASATQRSIVGVIDPVGVVALVGARSVNG